MQTPTLGRSSSLKSKPKVWHLQLRRKEDNLNLIPKISQILQSCFPLLLSTKLRVSWKRITKLSKKYLARMCGLSQIKWRFRKCVTLSEMRSLLLMKKGAKEVRPQWKKSYTIWVMNPSYPWAVNLTIGISRGSHQLCVEHFGSHQQTIICYLKWGIHHPKWSAHLIDIICLPLMKRKSPTHMTW